MATDTKADSSVVMALSELVRMEQDRIDSDREREQKRQADARVERERIELAAREAERQRIERAARDAQVAEAEARLRLEADRERDQRIAAMRAELARVESDRQTLRADLEHRLAPREPARASGWALAFGLSSLVAASLAGLLVMQQGTHEVPVATARAPIAVVSAPVPDAIPEITTPAAPEHVVETVATVEPPARIHRHRLDRTQVDDGHSTAHGTDIIGLDDEGGDEDVLGGIAHGALQH